MQGIRESGMCSIIAVGLLVFAAANPVAAQGDFVTPSANTNIIGITPDPANIRDMGLKQQQEPSCIVRPGNEAYIFCAYNDLRAADLTTVQGDSWMGVSMSSDAGQTWYSRLAPGFLGHPNSLGMGFAADPGVVAIPGNSPGLAILNYIAAFRDSDAGVLAIQRWVEFPQEDQDFWKPENRIITVADGSEGRFIDKPAFYYLVDPVSQQGTINEQVFVEGETAPIAVSTPTGTLIVVYAVFTGNSGGAKLLLRRSSDNGKTWTNSIKISEEQNQVTGVSVTAVGQDFVVVYRRKGDSNEPDAILSALCSNDGNQRCGKGEVVFQICPFDQPASGATFRTFSFPWAANDGKRFWAFAADRRYAGNSCIPVPGSPGLFGGKPRIVGMSSLDGKTWVGDAIDKTVPFQIAPRDEGFQLMPVAFGTKGRIDIAWYDTFREENAGLPAGANDILINDYLSGGVARVFRKADVYMTLLTASCGNNANAGCTPITENPVRVSQYQFAVDLADPKIGAEIEAHLPNLTLYGSGTLAFNGDYISLATPGSREIAGGKWIPNSLPGGSSELPGYTAAQDLFVAWGDNRDVRADIPALDSDTPLPYTPPLNSDAAPGGPMSRLEDDEATDDSDYERPGELVAEDEPDNDPVLPSDIGVCEAGFDYSRSRDSNVYSSLVRDEPSLIAPTPTKPLGTIQRMFPLILTNIDVDDPKNFCLHIENQPLDYPAGTPPVEGSGLASFYQLPSFAPFMRGDEVDFLDVEVPAGSSASRAAFVTTNNGESVVTINAYEGACPILRTGPKGPLVSSVQLSDGDLFDPVFCQENPDDPVCDDVNVNETHDIAFAAPVLQTAVLQAPTFQTPTLQTPTLQTPTFQTPTFQTPTFQTPTFQTPTFQTPTFQTPTFQTPTFQTPTLQTPTFQTPTFQSGTLIGDTAETEPQSLVYQDVTYPVNADANVTTTYSADIALSGLDPNETAVQLIAWTPNVYATAVDCYTQPIADQQIIAYTDLDADNLASVTLPTTFSTTNQDPYAGELSFFGQPDKDVAVTVRIWAVGDAKQMLLDLQTARQACEEGGGGESCEDFGPRQMITFGASAHACKTGDAIINSQNPNSPDCLNNGNEKILEDRTGPAISFTIDSSLEATGPNGAAVTYTATATDNVDSAPTLECLPASGTTFALGSNTVSCFAEDSASNSTIANFDVIVVDTKAPEFDVNPLPNLGPFDADNANGKIIDYALPRAMDAVNADPVVTCMPAPGFEFPLGDTPVSCTATDGTNTSPESSFMISVTDQTAPSISAPATVTVLARDANDSDVTYPLDSGTNSVTVEANLPPPYGAAITFTPVVSDAVNANPAITCSPASGAILDEGPTSVVCSAFDGFNTSGTISFSILIVDTTEPVFSVVDGTVYTFDANTAGGAYVDLVGDRGLVATDRGETIYPTCVATPLPLDVTRPIPLPALLAPGDYSVECSVDGVTTTISVTVVVDIVDEVPPVLTIPGDGTATVKADATTGIATVDLFGAIFDTNGDGVGDASITATDIVDTSVDIVCTPPSGTFSIGTYVISCTASDDGPNALGDPNSTTLSFTLIIVFPYDINLILSNKPAQAGSTIPIDWQYLDGGAIIDSGFIDPKVSWFGPFDSTDTSCSNMANMNVLGDDAGNSDKRYSASSMTWQFSWKTPDLKNKNVLLVISPPGEIDPEAIACVRLK